MTVETLLYTELAEWWPLLSHPDEYADEAAHYQAAMESTGAVIRDVLELGCGGGNNACHLKARYRMTLVDRAAGMLAVSRRLNPECPHFQGDMRDFRLDRTFDAVFIHDAIMYMTSEADLKRAICTAFHHCRPGGVALLVPDCFLDCFRPRTSHGGHDGPDRALRYLSWDYDPDPTDTVFITDYAYLLRHVDGSVQVLQDRHHLGVFPRKTWHRLMAETGFHAEILPCDHRSDDEDVLHGILGLKPG